MMPFGAYARYYDLLYRDKNYAGEAEYVARTIRSAVPDACNILESRLRHWATWVPLGE